MTNGSSTTAMSVVASDTDLIRNLISRSARLLDERKFDEWAALFMPDGSFNRTTGRGTLASNMKKSEMALDLEMMRQHLVVNSEIEVDGPIAKSTSTLLMYDLVERGNWSLTVGRYDDTFSRTDEGWRLQHRQLTMPDGPPNLPKD